MAIFEFIGTQFLQFSHFCASFGRFFIFYFRLTFLFFTPPFRSGIIAKHIVNMGFNSIPIIFMVGIFTGLIFAIQLYSGFKQFGAQSFIGYTVFIAVCKELGPVFTTLMVISRCISSMSAELGTMRVTEQIDALSALAVNPKKYLLVPRIIATIISLPVLTIIFNFVANVSAYFICIYSLDINASAFLETITQLGQLSNIYTGLIKSFFFAIAIGSIGCYVGYFTTGGARGVGISTTKAVVLSSMATFFLDYILSTIFLVFEF